MPRGNLAISRGAENDLAAAAAVLWPLQARELRFVSDALRIIWDSTSRYEIRNVRETNAVNL